MGGFNNHSIVIQEGKGVVGTGSNLYHELGIKHIVETIDYKDNPIRLFMSPYSGYRNNGFIYDFILLENGLLWNATIGEVVWLQHEIVVDEEGNQEEIPSNAVMITEKYYYTWLENVIDVEMNSPLSEGRHAVTVEGGAVYELDYDSDIAKFCARSFRQREVRLLVEFLIGWGWYEYRLYSNGDVQVSNNHPMVGGSGSKVFDDFVTIARGNLKAFERDTSDFCVLYHSGHLYRFNHSGMELLAEDVIHFTLYYRSSNWREFLTSRGVCSVDEGLIYPSVTQAMDLSNSLFLIMDKRVFITRKPHVRFPMEDFDPNGLNEVLIPEHLRDGELLEVKLTLFNLYHLMRFPVIDSSNNVSYQYKVYKNWEEISVGPGRPGPTIHNQYIYDFTHIPGTEDVVGVSLGRGYSLFLNSDSTVSACGNCRSGEIPLNVEGGEIEEVTIIPGLSGVREVSAGYYHSLFLMDDGSVKGCGRTMYGELGYVSYDVSYELIDLLVPEDNLIKEGEGVEGEEVAGSKGVGEEGERLFVPISNVKKVVAGYECSFILLNDGRVLRSGYGYYGKLGSGDREDIKEFKVIEGIPKVKDIGCCEDNTILVLEDGRVMSSGYGYYGCNGLGHNEMVFDFTFVPDPDVEVVEGGEVKYLEGVDKCVCGNNSVILIMNDGSLKGFGDNYYNKLGIKTEESRVNHPKDIIENIEVVEGEENKIIVEQVAMGRDHSVFLCEGSLLSNGYNYYGQLGLGEENRYVEGLQTDVGLVGVSLVWDWIKKIKEGGLNLYVKTKSGWKKANSLYVKTVSGWKKVVDNIKAKTQSGWR